MHDRIPISRSILPNIIYGCVIAIVRTTEKLTGVFVLGGCLLSFDSGEGVAVSLVEIFFLAEGAETNFIWVD